MKSRIEATAMREFKLVKLRVTFRGFNYV